LDTSGEVDELDASETMGVPQTPLASVVGERGAAFMSRPGLVCVGLDDMKKQTTQY
jgi:hypothetical protein